MLAALLSASTSRHRNRATVGMGRGQNILASIGRNWKIGLGKHKTHGYIYAAGRCYWHGLRHSWEWVLLGVEIKEERHFSWIWMHADIQSDIAVSTQPLLLLSKQILRINHIFCECNSGNQLYWRLLYGSRHWTYGSVQINDCFAISFKWAGF